MTHYDQHSVNVVTVTPLRYKSLSVCNGNAAVVTAEWRPPLFKPLVGERERERERMMAHICQDHLPTTAPYVPSRWLLLLNRYLTANPAEITGRQVATSSTRERGVHKAAIKSV